MKTWLYDLIFMKRPNENAYTTGGLFTHFHIMKETRAYLNLSRKRTKSSASYVYKNIIKRIILLLSPYEGRGLLKLAKNKSEFYLLG